MTTPNDPRPLPCPNCAGPRLPGPAPRGLLAWQHAQTCPLLTTEDATQANDYRLALPRSMMTRPSTETERTLLGVLGMVMADGTPPTADLEITSGFPAPASAPGTGRICIYLRPVEGIDVVRTRVQLPPDARQPQETEPVDRLVVYPFQGGVQLRWRDVHAFLARMP